MTMQTLKIDDKELIILTREAFDDLMENAGVLPALPAKDENGTMDAREALHVSIARGIVSRRIRAGLTQIELARKAGVRCETICRLEAAKQIPRQETIVRIDAALKQASESEK